MKRDGFYIDPLWKINCRRYGHAAATMSLQYPPALVLRGHGSWQKRLLHVVHQGAAHRNGVHTIMSQGILQITTHSSSLHVTIVECNVAKHICLERRNASIGCSSASLLSSFGLIVFPIPVRGVMCINNKVRSSLEIWARSSRLLLYMDGFQCGTTWSKPVCVPSSQNIES
jgi:hypothetical protein